MTASLRQLLILPLVLVLGGCASLEVLPDSTELARKDAILILPGLGMKRGAVGDVRAFASQADSANMDVFLADYKRRASLEAGVDALRRFIQDSGVERYERVHVFAYILGGYTFNAYLSRYEMPNLVSIVYDRSPLQELAPALATQGWFSVLTWLAVGPVVADLARTPYESIPNSDTLSIGLIVENRATRFVRKRRKKALALRPLTFEPDSLGQPYDDVFHVPFNHVEMYSSFGRIGPELLHFFQVGAFTGSAARQPLQIDPFSKTIEENRRD